MNQKRIQYVSYRKKQGKVVLRGKIGSIAAKAFCRAINSFELRNEDKISIDFSKIQRPYINGMLPIISMILNLKGKGCKVDIIQPENSSVKRLFNNYNWKRLLINGRIKPSKTRSKTAYTNRFVSGDDQHRIVNEFIDFILGSVVIDKNIIMGLEWTVNELTDNVLNHSNSKKGGVLQAILNRRTKEIEFGIVDDGIGIPKSIQPVLRKGSSDLDAINEAIKSGVTRDKRIGQGNGLAGSLKIASLCKGTFEVRSGRGWLNLGSNQKAQQLLFHENESFKGTLVTVMMNLLTPFSIIEGLSVSNTIAHFPSYIIDTKYEMETVDSFYIKMNEENIGYGNRQAGEFVRTKVLNLVKAENNYPIIIDWEGVPFISSSFADEFIGKLFVNIGADKFNKLIKNSNMDNLITKLIHKSISQRLEIEE